MPRRPREGQGGPTDLLRRLNGEPTLAPFLASEDTQPKTVDNIALILLLSGDHIPAQQRQRFPRLGLSSRATGRYSHLQLRGSSRYNRRAHL